MSTCEYIEEQKEAFKKFPINEETNKIIGEMLHELKSLTFGQTLNFIKDKLHDAMLSSLSDKGEAFKKMFIHKTHSERVYIIELLQELIFGFDNQYF